jgi:hypothetical protein
LEGALPAVAATFSVGFRTEKGKVEQAPNMKAAEVIRKSFIFKV